MRFFLTHLKTPNAFMFMLKFYSSSIYCRPAGRDYSKKKGYFRDEGEGPNFQATPAGQVEDSSVESAPCM
jgi:hypothetical protein